MKIPRAWLIALLALFLLVLIAIGIFGSGSV
jgi:hypothetical protein